jgi:hypothetical protein
MMELVTPVTLPRKVPLFPLTEFYPDQELPPIVSIPPEQVPQPQKRLLVHNADMTPALEAFYGTRVDLEVLKASQTGMIFMREVVLVLGEERTPVEFGAIQIHLSNFLPEHRKVILENQIPLGTILHDFAIEHQCYPSAYIRVIPDDFILEALHLKQPEPLYGRCNAMRDLYGWPLAEVVEILPPAWNNSTE